VEISGFNVPLTRSKFDIAVFVIERGESIECLWVYSTELFDESTVNNMAGMLATVLGDAVANPDKRVGALELYSEEQQQKLKEAKQERKRSTKEKLMSAGLKAVDLGNGTGA
jgi:non-ribosomal peptide synthetase component F